MKLNFKKVASVLASAAMMGSTMGMAAAAAYPMPFMDGNSQDVAIVVGSATGADDLVAANALGSDLATSSTSVGEDGSSVMEDEVPLGGTIVAGDIKATMDDSDLDSLRDDQFSWDDGDGSDDYDFHDEIVIGTMNLITTLNDEDLEGVALTNEQGLSYRYVLEDTINTSLIGTDDADTLYMTILGKSYEVEGMDTNQISVVTSEEFSLSKGDSVTVDGETFTVEDMSTTSVKVNGETISDGNSKKINGLQVEVDEGSIFYNENFPDTASVTLKIGDDISKTYTNGDEYLGEDEDDPLWVWDISITKAGDLTTANDYIGVTYNVKVNDADDEEAGDTIKYESESYVLPEGFGAVTLDGLTEVDYAMLKVYFDDAVDIYNATDSVGAVEDQPVIVVEIEGSEYNDAITVGAEETNKIYLFYSNAGEITGADPTDGSILAFYQDTDGDYTPTGKARFAGVQANLTADGTIARTELATIEVGDTDLAIDMSVTGGIPSLFVETTTAGGNDVTLTIGGDAINTSGATGSFEQLGATLEDADENDIIADGTDVSTKDESVMDDYGIIVAEEDGSGVEGNADDDMVVLSIPDERVYGMVSVSAGAAVSTANTPAVVITDAEAGSASDKNLIVVGGSCVNSLAASLLGVASPTCEGAFTTATGVGSGEYIIKTVARGDKLATVVAGYEKADTANGVNALMAGQATITAGEMCTGTTAAECS